MDNITKNGAKQQNRPSDSPQAEKVWISKISEQLGSGWLTQGIQVVYGVQWNPKGTHTKFVDLKARKWTMGPNVSNF